MNTISLIKIILGYLDLLYKSIKGAIRERKNKEFEEEVDKAEDAKAIKEKLNRAIDDIQRD